MITTTCNQLDMNMLGFWPIIPQNFSRDSELIDPKRGFRVFRWNLLCMERTSNFSTTIIQSQALKFIWAPTNYFDTSCYGVVHTYGFPGARERKSDWAFWRILSLDGFDWQPMTLFARRMGDKFDSRANLGTFEREKKITDASFNKRVCSIMFITFSTLWKWSLSRIQQWLSYKKTRDFNFDSSYQKNLIFWEF